MSTSDVLAPAMFEHCQTIYNLMVDDSTEEAVQVPDHVLPGLQDPEEDVELETVTRRVWEGRTTGLFQKAELPTPYYTKVIQNLKRMGCIEQLRRGGGAALSKWALCHDPSEELWTNSEAPEHHSSTKTLLQQVQQQNRDLTRRIQRLEQAVGI